MQNRIVGVVGPKGSGKTYTVSQMIQREPRSAVFNIMRESAYLCGEPIVGKPRQFAEMLRSNEFRINYIPTAFEREGDEISFPELDPFVTLCYLRGNMLMVIDESHLLLTARRCPTMLLISNWVGRHRRLSIVYVAQTFATVSVPLRRNTDEFFFWRMIEASDIDGVKDRCGYEVAEMVANLRATEDKRHEGGIIVPGQMLHWSKTHGVMEVTK